jgi:hypothetical protein
MYSDRSFLKFVCKEKEQGEYGGHGEHSLCSDLMPEDATGFLDLNIKHGWKFASTYVKRICIRF